jgi:hypothetical protein
MNNRARSAQRRSSHQHFSARRLLAPSLVTRHSQLLPVPVLTGIIVPRSDDEAQASGLLATYFVARSLSAANTIARIRRLRPGSLEANEQAAALDLYARRKRQQTDSYSALT